MLAFLTNIAAALLVPALATPASRPDCELDRLAYVNADTRAIGRFVAATHDYVADGRRRTIFDERAAEIFRFRLRVGRWLHRYDAAQTLAERHVTESKAHGADGAPGVVAAALPELPDELDYRLTGAHLLLVDRRTNDVVDVLPNAFDDGWGR